MSQRKTVDILRQQVGYDGFFKLSKFRLRHSLFNGSMSREMSRELFERGHAVAMLPYDPQRDELVLLEQFRIGALHDPNGPWLTEIVAGMIKDDERAEDVARREALEEAGCEINSLVHILNYYVSPGGTSETIALYCGLIDSSLVKEGIYGLDEENEDIRVFKVSYDQAIHWLRSGKINSAAPIIALQWLMMNREQLRQQSG
ncbi:MAG: ADP-ribose diphosphatase [Gammaproteobacteria bacterium]|nr:ADP-ribose diphosphatase [Gammaproteobacteria bacterium]